MEQQTLEQKLRAGYYDKKMIALYGKKKLDASRTRCIELICAYTTCFGALPAALFGAPGRTELGGNHTDHQHGLVLAASIDLDILAAVSPNHDGKIRIQSEGYSLIVIDLAELEPIPAEKNTSAALVRGVAAGFKALGCPIGETGLDIFVVSNVPGGSGLSSSAAFEVLLGTIINDFFHEGQCSPAEIAKIGQWAENNFFGKPCGLMDQLASSVGGVVFAVFSDAEAPLVEALPMNLEEAGYALCILDSGADHADLTNEYSSITNELKAVCGFFGKAVLREVPEDDFIAALSELRSLAGDRAVLRAFHIYSENRRVIAQTQALKRKDFKEFLRLVKESGCSSAQYLQNVVPTGQTANQALMLTIALCEKILDGTGAVRVHGGGFGGTAQAFVPIDRLDDFKTRTEAVLGHGHCHVLSVRHAGGVKL